MDNNVESGQPTDAEPTLDELRQGIAEAFSIATRGKVDEFGMSLGRAAVERLESALRAAVPRAPQEVLVALKRAALQLFKDGNGPLFEAEVRAILLAAAVPAAPAEPADDPHNVSSLCDPDVFARGEVVHVEHMRATEAERVVEGMRLADGSAKYDWHYIAGRAVFKRWASPLPAARPELPATVWVLETADGRLSSVWANEGEAEQARRLAVSPRSYAVTAWTVLGLPAAPAGPTDEEIRALQEALNCEPQPDEFDGWTYDASERLLWATKGGTP